MSSLLKQMTIIPFPLMSVGVEMLHFPPALHSWSFTSQLSRCCSWLPWKVLKGQDLSFACLCCPCSVLMRFRTLYINSFLLRCHSHYWKIFPFASFVGFLTTFLSAECPLMLNYETMATLKAEEGALMNKLSNYEAESIILMAIFQHIVIFLEHRIWTQQHPCKLVGQALFSLLCS